MCVDMYYLPQFLHMLLYLHNNSVCVVINIVFITWMKLRLKRVQ